MIDNELFAFTEAENGKTVPADKPIDMRDFMKICDHHRRYPVLYKLEFQVSIAFYVQ